MTEEIVMDKPEERFQIILKSDKYRERISQMALNGSTSLVIDFEDILIADSKLAEELLENPDEYLEYGNQAAFDQLQIQEPEYAEKIRDEGVTVRIRGIPYVTPLRELSSRHIGKLVMIEGIVIRATTVRPLVTRAVFKCRRCDQLIEVPQTGTYLTSPSKCTNPDCKATGGFEFVQEESEFIDSQEIRIQEYPEELPPGQTPRSLNIQLVGRDIVGCRSARRQGLRGWDSQG